jgi:hypothetical protein
MTAAIRACVLLESLNNIHIVTYTVPLALDNDR